MPSKLPTSTTSLPTVVAAAQLTSVERPPNDSGQRTSPPVRSKFTPTTRGLFMVTRQ